MNGTAANFMKAGLIYALAGVTLGVAMAASENFTLRSVHTHLNLIGWATMAIYAVYYQLVPEAARLGSARAHFWMANAGLIVLTGAVALLVSGVKAAAPGAAVGSIITLASLALFTFIVFKTSRRPD